MSFAGTTVHMRERRRHKRFESSMPARVELLQSGKATLHTAELCNIGSGGAYLKLKAGAALGTSIDLNILDHENRFGPLLGVRNSHDTLNLKIFGRVVRVESPNGDDPRQGVAMEFTSPVRFAPPARSEQPGAQ